MDLADAPQLIFAVTVALVLGRVGLAVARGIERRVSGTSPLRAETEDRLRVLEEECGLLRRELAEIQERQDFTERVLLQDPARARPPGAAPAPERSVTPR